KAMSRGSVFGEGGGEDSNQRKVTRREIDSKREVSEIIEEYDPATGRIQRRTTRTQSEESHISEHEMTGSGGMLEGAPAARLEQQLPTDWHQRVPSQLKVSIFQSSDAVPGELVELAGDYIAALADAGPQQAIWTYVFPSREGLHRLVVKATPGTAGYLECQVSLEGSVVGPRWLGVGDANWQQSITLDRDWNTPQTRIAPQKWPRSVEVVALAAGGNYLTHQASSQRFEISGAPTAAERAAMASSVGGSGSGDDDDDVPDDDEFPTCDGEECCSPDPPPPGPPESCCGNDGCGSNTCSGGSGGRRGGGGSGGGNGLGRGDRDFDLGGRGGSSCSGGTCSAFPVRYSSGEILFRQDDISSGGFGTNWGHTRSFCSRLTGNSSFGNGYNWQVREWSFLSFLRENGVIQTIVVQGQATKALWFDVDNGAFVARFGVKNELTYDAGNDLYVLSNPDGSILKFVGTTGAFKERVNPGGSVIQATQYSVDGRNPTQVERTYSINSQTIIEQLNYEFDASVILPLLQSVTLRRKVDAGSWENIVRASYIYYDFDEDYGLDGDLKTVTTAEWTGSAWSETGTSYFRYET
ncbi:hypothetical protein L1A08_00025, partial [Rubinisphaera sp. ICM_H10]